MTSKGSESIPGVDPKRALERELASADSPASAQIGVPVPDQSLLDDGSVQRGTGFDPTPYLRQLRGRAGGADYLDVKWRLLWLRKEHPDAEIVTELVQHDPQMAIFKATVTVPTGGKATGYGSETASDFPDFIEKAETKAIGRALNAFGYGAQFGDFQRPEELVPERGPELPGRQPAPAARPVALPRRDERPAQLPEVKNESAGGTPTDVTAPAVADQELVDY